MGEPGVGKTTIAKKLQNLLKKKFNVIHLDGDNLRDLYKNYNYSLSNRIQLAKNYLELMGYIAKQCDMVILSSIMLYPELNKNPIFKKSKKFLIKRKQNSKKKIKEKFREIMPNKIEHRNVNIIDNNKTINKSILEIVSSLKLDLSI